MPKVSIVLPSYNGERYICESIDSVIAQTFQDWELIIVDDCSTDCTPKIAEEYAGKDERIRVIHNEVNKKLPESLNVGFRQAQGNYLTWTSDDNIYLPDAIAKMLERMRRSSCAMVCADMDLIDGEGSRIGPRESYDPKSFYYENFVGACFLYRHDVLNEIGEYDKSFFLVEDYEYWMRIVRRFGAIERIDRVLYLYRDHGRSLSATRREEIRTARCRLRRNYMRDIIKFYSGDDADRKYLLWIYMDFLTNCDDISEMKRVIMPIVPETAIISETPREGEIAVYGAGKLGDAAYCEYGGRISAYIDKNAKCIGVKNGIPVFTLEDYLEMHRDAGIVVAIGREYLLEVLENLFHSGVERCSVLWEQYE